MVAYRYKSYAAIAMERFIPTVSPQDAMRAIVTEMREKRISPRDAVMLCPPSLIDRLIFPALDLKTILAEEIILRHSVCAPGVGSGKVARSVEEAEAYITTKTPYVLVLPETNASCLRAIENSAAVITFKGGMGSHAAIVARQLKKPAIIGCGKFEIESGAEITVDGSSGIVVKGIKEAGKADYSNPDMHELLNTARRIKSEKVKQMKVKGNADDPAATKFAREMGAEGTGVVRTEHMFKGDNLIYVQAMMLADNVEIRKKCLEQISPSQKEMFKGMLEANDGLPTTIRLLDAPQHEFMPTEKERIEAISEILGTSVAEVEERIKKTHEENSMLGKRSIRLAVMHPEIYETQTRLILEAAAELIAEGKNPQPQIMIPLISLASEVEEAKKMVEAAKAQVVADGYTVPHYKFGIMAEIPTVCLEGAKYAKNSQFWSFGTNDLTQTTHGWSRDDLPEVTNVYMEKSMLLHDPFQTVSSPTAILMDFGIKKAKAENPELEFSVCGEHGGDEASIHTFQKIGIDCVSVSPPRIPYARLVCAQAMILEERRLEVGGWAADLAPMPIAPAR